MQLSLEILLRINQRKQILDKLLGKGHAVVVKSFQISTSVFEKWQKASGESLFALPEHQNVASFLGVVSADQTILFEYFPESLKDYIQANQLPVATLIGILEKVADGMLHLHKHNIIHKALAARNVFLEKSGDFICPVVVDYSLTELSKLAQDESSDFIKWLAPEAIAEKKFNEKTDVWSFGVLCYECVMKQDPFPNMDAVKVGAEISFGGRRPTLPEEKDFPLINRVMKQCFERDPENRPSFDKLVVQLVHY